MNYPILSMVLMLVLMPLHAYAQNDAQEEKEPLPEVERGETIEPQVTIIEEEGRTVHEYSVNGHVYMVKIVPEGDYPPYYLLDLDGDGMMDVRRDGPDDIAVPQWVLFRW